MRFNRSHRQLMGIYIQRARTVEISQSFSISRPTAAVAPVSGQSPFRPACPRRWIPPPSTEIYPAVAAVEDLRQVRVKSDPFVPPFLILCTKVFAMILATVCNFYSSYKLHRLDSSKDFRFKFPQNTSRTARSGNFGVTDLALAIALVRLGTTELY